VLLDHIVNYCNRAYKNAYLLNICNGCKQPQKCPANRDCADCLDEVHFPEQHPNGKREYDCNNMLNFYVCRYTHKYCSEIEYALNQIPSLKNFEKYKVLSIGCGAAPDLMALEAYRNKNNIDSKIIYKGLDKNVLWQATHAQIENYVKNKNIKVRFHYVDAIDYMKSKYWPGANLLILQYVISYLYNTNRIKDIDTFFDDLIKNVVSRKNDNEPIIIIINDVNNNYRGIDYFEDFEEKLRKKRFNVKTSRMYFNYGIKNEKQRYGTPYSSYKNLYIIPQSIRTTYKSAIYCSSAQLIIEVE